MPDTELLATSEIEGAIALSDMLKGDIRANDRIPSFDGDVYIQPHGSSKKDLKAVRVQVKGRTVETQGELGRDEVTYQADMADLENYNRNGGVLFFYVLICNGRRKAFYSSLLPVKLRMLLREGGGQASKSIALEPLPDDASSLEEILINHYEQSKMQFSFCDAELPGADIAHVPAGTRYSLRYTSIARNEYEALSHLIGKENYLYFENERCPIPIPTGEMVSVVGAKRTVSADVSAGGTSYYDAITVSMSEEHDTLTIGCLSCTFPPGARAGQVRCDFKLSGSFRERLNALRFLDGVLESGSFEINGTSVCVAKPPARERFESQGLEETLGFFEDVAAVLSSFGDNEDFDIGEIGEKDIEAVLMLKAGLVMGRRLPLASDGMESAVCSVGFLGRHYLVYRYIGEDGLSAMRDFVTYDTSAKIVDKDTGREYEITKYGVAYPSELMDVCNLDPAELARSCIEAGYNPHNCGIANDVALALLGRFDAIGCRGDLAAAESLLSWLTTDNNPFRETIHVVNELQAKLRSRRLAPQDRDAALGIIEEDKRKPQKDRALTVACLSIVGRNKEARAAFRKLSKMHRESIEAHPIGNLINGRARYAGEPPAACGPNQ